MDGLAVLIGDHQNGNAGVSRRFDLLRVEGNEPVAPLHPPALCHKGGKAVAVHAYGVQADVEQDLHAVVQQNAAGVAGALVDHGDLPVSGGQQNVVGGLNGQTVAQDLLRKHLVGNFVNGNDLAGEVGAQFHLAGGDLYRSGFRLGLRGGIHIGGSQLFLADDVGQREGDRDGDEHTDGEAADISGLDGQDAGQAAHADGIGGCAGGDADYRRAGRADHTAEEGEVVLQVHAEHGGLRHSQVAGDAGGNVDLLGVGVLPLEGDHAEDGGALGNVGQCDHGPEHGAAEIRRQLHINGVGHMMESRDDQGGVDEAEDGAENHLEGPGDARVDRGGDGGADLPADGPQNKVGCDHRQQQAAEGDHDHTDDRRRNFPEELFQIHQGEGREDRRDHLGLIADHVHMEKAEVPAGDRFGGGHAVGIQKLAGDQGQSKDDAQHLGGPHLLGDGPADAYGQHMEHRLADEPEEAVQPGPELAEVAEGLGAVFK